MHRLDEAYGIDAVVRSTDGTGWSLADSWYRLFVHVTQGLNDRGERPQPLRGIMCCM